MVKKIPGQSDMFDKWSPKVKAMRRLRAHRSEAGFREINIWVPADKVQQIRSEAERLRNLSGKDFPSGSDDA